MRHIVVRLHRATDVSATMTAMHRWLDDHRCEPSRLKCDRSPGWFDIRADFKQDEDADSFRNRFGGSEERSARGTMAQVCWWRLMAEEIRTEADAFSSSSAKQTMLVAARTLDRMARDLERRLEKN